MSIFPVCQFLVLSCPQTFVHRLRPIIHVLHPKFTYFIINERVGRYYLSSLFNNKIITRPIYRAGAKIITNQPSVFKFVDFLMSSVLRSCRTFFIASCIVYALTALFLALAISPPEIKKQKRVEYVKLALLPIQCIRIGHGFFDNLLHILSRLAQIQRGRHRFIFRYNLLNLPLDFLQRKFQHRRFIADAQQEDIVNSRAFMNF